MSDETADAFVVARINAESAAETLKEACDADGEDFREVMEEIIDNND